MNISENEKKNNFLIEQIRHEKDILDRRLNRLFIYQSGLFIFGQYLATDPEIIQKWPGFEILFFIIAILLSLQSSAVVTANLYSQHDLKVRLKEKNPEHEFFLQPKWARLIGDYSIIIIPYLLLFFWIKFANLYF